MYALVFFAALFCYLLHVITNVSINFVLKIFAGNHIGMAKSLHYKNVVEYRYWDQDKRCIDFEGWVEDLRVSSLNNHLYVMYFTMFLDQSKYQDKSK